MSCGNVLLLTRCRNRDAQIVTMSCVNLSLFIRFRSCDAEIMASFCCLLRVFVQEASHQVDTFFAILANKSIDEQYFLSHCGVVRNCLCSIPSTIRKAPHDVDASVSRGQPRAPGSCEMSFCQIKVLQPPANTRDLCVRAVIIP